MGQFNEEIISQAASGNRQATRQLFWAVYEDLKRAASAQMKGEAAGHTLTPTALVHEVFLKLGPDQQWNDSAHLYRTAVKAMRQVLVDAARSRRAEKRGGDARREELPVEGIAGRERRVDPIELEEALAMLESQNLQAAQVFGLRYFGGLTWEQIAEELGVSVERVGALWSYAKVKLASAISEPG